MSRMDISERRVPQDGRIKLKVRPDQAIDFRVNTLPTLYGEKVVLRILDPGSTKLDVDALGFEPEQKALFLSALTQPQGMILVTGPTGSEKPSPSMRGSISSIRRNAILPPPRIRWRSTSRASTRSTSIPG